MTSKTMQLAVIERCRRMLDAVGVPYLIESPDGEVYGLMEKMKKAPEPRRVVRNDWEAETGYSALMKKLPKGEVLQFNISEPDKKYDGQVSSRVESFHSSLRGLAVRSWGANGFLTTREGGLVEIIRIE